MNALSKRTTIEEVIIWLLTNAHLYIILKCGRACTKVAIDTHVGTFSQTFGPGSPREGPWGRPKSCLICYGVGYSLGRVGSMSHNPANPILPPCLFQTTQKGWAHGLGFHYLGNPWRNWAETIKKYQKKKQKKLNMTNKWLWFSYCWV